MLEFLRDYNPWPRLRQIHTNIAGDIVAGITVAFVALPFALAMGVASGMGAISGVYASIAGGLIGGPLGGTNVGVSGATGPKTVQLAMILQEHRLADGGPDLAFAFGCVAISGLIMLALAFMKIGRFIYYTPYSVISGFMCAIGAILLIQQFRPLIGLPVMASIQGAMRDIPHALLETHFDALFISILTLVIIILWAKLVKIVWLPGPLVAIILASLVAYVLGLRIEYIPDVPTGIPELRIPPLSRFFEMFPPAAALAGLAVYDSLMTCIVIDQKTGDRHNSDQELFGQGMGNLCAGLFGGLTIATATVRSLGNISFGARTVLASITHGVFLLSLVLGLAPLATYVPLAALAAVLYKVGWDILDWRVFPVLRRLSRTDKICFWATFLVTMSVDLLVAVSIGLAIAFFRFVKQMSELSAPRVISLEDPKEPLPGRELVQSAFRDRIGIVQPEGPIFFGIADALYQTSQFFTKYDVVIVSFRHVPVIDLSGAFALEDLVEQAHALRTHVLFADVRREVRRELEQLETLKKIKEENCFDTFEQAATRAQELISEKNGVPPLTPAPALL